MLKAALALATIVLLVAVMALLMAAMATPAFAAPQGQVERGPEHANSICSYSGLNDTPDDPEEGGQVQSYGQLVRQGFIAPSELERPTSKAGAPSPGFFCNAHNFPLQEGSPEE
jgi:hypothetical protein